ncbi:MAG TPA: response regulator [Candidatus Marinimicrobia bacterium]|nr:response regulator [Candidatus Neomarinimicrobiota bacterium]
MARVLIIDDEADIRALLRATLEAKHRYLVYEASDGGEGLSLQRKYNADLIIIDILMPKKGGFETIKEIRRLYPKVPVFAISGATYQGSKNLLLDKAHQLGAVRVFPKPFDIDVLISAVEEYLPCTAIPEPISNTEKETSFIAKIKIPLIIGIAFITGFILAKLL